MADIILVAGNTAPDLVFTLRNALGVQNLTGASVALRLQREGVAPLVAPCTIDAPPTAGVVRYHRTGLEPAGRYVLELIVTFADATIATFPSGGALPLIIRAPGT